MLLLVLGWLIFHFILPCITGTIMNVMPCLEYCFKPSATEGGHKNYSDVVDHLHGLHSYFIHDNEVYMDAFALDTKDPSRVRGLRNVEGGEAHKKLMSMESGEVDVKEGLSNPLSKAGAAKSDIGGTSSGAAVELTEVGVKADDLDDKKQDDVEDDVEIRM